LLPFFICPQTLDFTGFSALFGGLFVVIFGAFLITFRLLFDYLRFIRFSLILRAFRHFSEIYAMRHFDYLLKDLFRLIIHRPIQNFNFFLHCPIVVIVMSFRGGNTYMPHLTSDQFFINTGI
jgi:hypothetical protein